MHILHSSIYKFPDRVYVVFFQEMAGISMGHQYFLETIAIHKQYLILQNTVKSHLKELQPKMRDDFDIPMDLFTFEMKRRCVVYPS